MFSGDVIQMNGWVSKKELREICDEVRTLQFRAGIEQPFIDEMTRMEYNRRRRLGAPAYQGQPYAGASVELKRSCRRAVYQTWAMLSDMHRTVIVAEREGVR
jgi:hypothetical protein